MNRFDIHYERFNDEGKPEMLNPKHRRRETQPRCWQFFMHFPFQCSAANLHSASTANLLFVLLFCFPFLRPSRAPRELICLRSRSRTTELRLTQNRNESIESRFCFNLSLSLASTIADSPTLFYEDVIRDEKLKDIANKITNITTSTATTTSLPTTQTSTQEKERKSRWTTISETQISEETPTRDDISSSSKQKRPQSLAIHSSAPAIISAVIKKKNGPPEIINYTTATTTTTTSSNSTQKTLERGDPDGDCGMEDSPTSYCNKTVELRVKLPSEQILHSKNGWLMKEDHQGEWSKYWFSLKGGGLFYYRDPGAEERGVLDGVLDVNSITGIKEITTNRNHAFQLTVIIFFFFLISLLVATNAAAICCNG